ncbi:MAG: hypothetical protein J6Y29_03155 [Clostridiales bacterium]|nr:hypothetical protein [Clostridiales bacterium]
MDTDILSEDTIDLGIRTGISGVVVEIISGLIKTFLNVVFLIVNLGFSLILDLMHTTALWLIKKIRVNFAIDETFFTNSQTQFGNVLSVFKDATQIVGLSIIILIVLWQLFKIFFKSGGIETDDPMKLGVRLIIYGILVGKAYDIINMIIVSIYSPVVNGLLSIIYDSDIMGLNKDMSLTNVMSMILGSLGTVLKLDSSALKSFGTFSTLIQGLVLLYIDYNIVLVVFKFAERAVTLFILTLISPLTFACGVSKNTKHIFEGWIKAFVGVLVMYFVYNLTLVLVILFLYLSNGGQLTISGAVHGFNGQTSFIFATGMLLGILSIMDQAENIAKELGFNTGGSVLSVKGSINSIRAGTSMMQTGWEKTKGYFTMGLVVAGKLNKMQKNRIIRKRLKEVQKVKMYQEGLNKNPQNELYKKKLDKHIKKLDKLTGEQELKEQLKKKGKYEDKLKSKDLSEENRKKFEDKLRSCNNRINRLNEKIQDKKEEEKEYEEGKGGRRRLDKVKNKIEDKKMKIDELKVDKKGQEIQKEIDSLLSKEQQIRQAMFASKFFSKKELENNAEYMALKKEFIDDPNKDDKLGKFKKRGFVDAAMNISFEIEKKRRELRNHYKEVDAEIKNLQKSIAKDSTDLISVRGKVKDKNETKIQQLNEKINKYDHKIKNLDNKIAKATGEERKKLEDQKSLLEDKKNALKEKRDMYATVNKNADDIYVAEKQQKFKINKSKLIMNVASDIAGVDRNIVDFGKKILTKNNLDNILGAYKESFEVATDAIVKLSPGADSRLHSVGRREEEKIYNRYMDNEYKINYATKKISSLEKQKERLKVNSDAYKEIQAKIDKQQVFIDKCKEDKKTCYEMAKSRKNDYDEMMKSESNKISSSDEKMIEEMKSRAKNSSYKYTQEDIDNAVATSNDKKIREQQRQKREDERNRKRLQELINNYEGKS